MFDKIAQIRRIFLRITKDDIIQIAKMAKIRLTDKEIVIYQNQLQRLLQYFAFHKMEDIETIEDIKIDEAKVKVENKLFLAKDVGQPCKLCEVMKENAPSLEHECFKVPEIL